eukprot:3916053-Rhodomonas_salina.1
MVPQASVPLRGLPRFKLVTRWVHLSAGPAPHIVDALCAQCSVLSLDADAIASMLLLLLQHCKGNKEKPLKSSDLEAEATSPDNASTIYNNTTMRSSIGGGALSVQPSLSFEVARARSREAVRCAVLTLLPRQNALAGGKKGKDDKVAEVGSLLRVRALRCAWQPVCYVFCCYCDECMAPLYRPTRTGGAEVFLRRRGELQGLSGRPRSGSRVSGLGFRVQGSGFRVQ